LGHAWGTRLRRGGRRIRLGLGGGLALTLLGLPGTVGADAPAAGETALDRFFRGTIVGLEGSKVRIRYDFSNPEQMKDWVEGVPWNIVKNPGDGAGISEGRLNVRGNAGAHHVGEWEGDLLVTCKLIPDGTKDMGSYVSSPDQANDYISYTIAEYYFHGWDHEGSGGDTGMMKFGKQFSAVQNGGFTGFRYLAFRRPPADPTPGKAVLWSFGRKGEKLTLGYDDMKLESVEPGIRLKVMRAGFYSIQSSISVDDVVIEGTLAPRYLAARKIALRTERPIVAEVAAGIDPAVQTLITAYGLAKESASKLVQVVGDPSRAEGDRAAAAAALKAGPRKALPAIIDLLYSPDPKIRASGLEIVKAMTGKTYGYDPRAGEKARGGAVAKLNEDIKIHPELLQGNGG